MTARTAGAVPSTCRAPTAEEAHDMLMLRSVGAMTIAEGDAGWQLIPIDCPMLVAVAKLRNDFDTILSQNATYCTLIAELKEQNERLVAALRQVCISVGHNDAKHIADRALLSAGEAR